MGLFPILLFVGELIFSNVESLPAPDNTENTFYNALAINCPLIKSVPNFKNQEIFSKCTDWKKINETQTLTENTESSFLCLLYYDSFSIFCAEIVAQQKPADADTTKYFLPTLKDSKVETICKNLSIFPPGKKFEHNATQVLKTDLQCVKLCSTYDGIPKIECSSAYYFANFNLSKTTKDGIKSSDQLQDQVHELHVQNQVEGQVPHKIAQVQEQADVHNVAAVHNKVRSQAQADAPDLTQAVVAAPAKEHGQAQAQENVSDPESNKNPSKTNTAVGQIPSGLGKADNTAPEAQIPGKSDNPPQDIPPVIPPNIAAPVNNNPINQAPEQPNAVVKSAAPPAEQQQATNTNVGISQGAAPSGEKEASNTHNVEETVAANPIKAADTAKQPDTGLDGNMVDTDIEIEPPVSALQADQDMENPDENPAIQDQEDDDEEQAYKKEEEEVKKEEEGSKKGNVDANKEELKSVAEKQETENNAKKEDTVVMLPDNIPINSANAGDADGESYFFSYFMAICVLFVLGYVGYHNRQKVMALVVEGKRGKRQYRGRRPNSANYHKLDSNLEEAISSSCTKNPSQVIY